jgi:predicted ArsR family transcriptional regulator
MDALEAVGDPELRDAFAFAAAQEHPITADDLAESQSVHRNVARARLERLVEAGLLAPAYERRTGRTGPGAGRPAKTYAVLPQLKQIEFPERRYETLVSLLVESLPSRGREAQLVRVGLAFARELAASAGLRPVTNAEQGFERMCAAVGQLGFQASVVELDATQVVIETPTCPLRPLVRKRPEVAAVDRGMWIGLASHAVKGASVDTVECETHGCDADHASCRVLIRFARPL